VQRGLGCFLYNSRSKMASSSMAANDADAARRSSLVGEDFAENAEEGWEAAVVVRGGDDLLVVLSRTETSVRGRITVGMTLGPRWGAPIAMGWPGSCAPPAGRIATGTGTTAPVGGGSKRDGGDGRCAETRSIRSRSARLWLLLLLRAPMMMLARHSSLTTRGFSHTASCCCREMPSTRRCTGIETRSCERVSGNVYNAMEPQQGQK
jgi:hypothetical protein